MRTHTGYYYTCCYISSVLNYYRLLTYLANRLTRQRQGLVLFRLYLPHTSAYVSIRVPHAGQHTSAYVSICQHTSACLYLPGPRNGGRQLVIFFLELLERQHTSAYVSIRQHTAAYVLRMLVSIRRHTSADVRIRQHTCSACWSAYVGIRQHTAAYVFRMLVSIRRHTSAYVSIRQHTCSACWPC
jgi:hypothetical protein